MNKRIGIATVTFYHNGVKYTKMGEAVINIDDGIFIYDSECWSGHLVNDENDGTVGYFLFNFPEDVIPCFDDINFLMFPGKWFALPTVGQYAFLRKQIQITDSSIKEL